MNNNYHIILFDGECSFCSFWVRYILKRDKNDVFRFASLQSSVSQELLSNHKVDPKVDSVVFIDQNHKVFVKSNAVFEILFYLGGIRKLFYGFKIFPRIIRDFVYDIIAKIRYKLFKRETCELPMNTEFKNKFL